MRIILVLSSILLAFGFVYAQEKPSEADMAKLMADYDKLMSPGPEHQMMATCVGDWNVASKWYPAKGAPAMESTGSNTYTMILGGRFLQSNYQGEMMGKTFRGVGVEGYDTIKKKYTMFWSDETSTAMYTAEGMASPDGKIITYMGKHDDPLTGEKNLDVKYVFTMVDSNQHTFQIIEKPGTPNEYVAAEMVYTRK